MSSEGYHLQYHLYTLAAVRYLKSRLPNFDYERHFGGVIYLFLRGIRQGKDTGVFCCKPGWEKLEKMEALFQGEGAAAMAVKKGVKVVGKVGV